MQQPEPETAGAETGATPGADAAAYTDRDRMLIASDAVYKTNAQLQLVTPASASAILASVRNIPIYQYAYNNATNQLHIGPFAQTTGTIQGWNTTFPSRQPLNPCLLDVGDLAGTTLACVQALAAGGSGGSAVWEWVAGSGTTLLTPLASGGDPTGTLVFPRNTATTGAGTRISFSGQDGSLRAGSVTGSQWDAPGPASVAFGLNNSALSARSAAVAGSGNAVDLNSPDSGILCGTANLVLTGCSASAVVCGNDNQLSGSGACCAIVAGGSNRVSGASDSCVGAGTGNRIESLNTTPATLCAIAGGASNVIAGCPAAFVGGGSSNTVSGSVCATVCGGQQNVVQAGSGHCFIGGGFANQVTASEYCAIAGGYSLTVSSSNMSAIVAGNASRIIQGSWSAIGAGSGSAISESAGCFVGAGESCFVDRSSNAFVGAGVACGITSSDYAFIGAGTTNAVSSSPQSGLVAGVSNTVTGGGSCFMGAGEFNALTDSTRSAVVCGTANTMFESDKCAVVCGQFNGLSASGVSGVLCGSYNTLATSNNCACIGGYSSRLGGCESTIICGDLNSGSTMIRSAFIGGDSNEATGSYRLAVVCSTGCTVDAGDRNGLLSCSGDYLSKCDGCVSLGGVGNAWSDSTSCAIVVGNGNAVVQASNSAVLSGVSNSLLGSVNCSVLWGSENSLSTKASGVGGTGNSCQGGNTLITGSDNNCSASLSLLVGTKNVVGGNGKSQLALVSGTSNTIEANQVGLVHGEQNGFTEVDHAVSLGSGFRFSKAAARNVLVAGGAYSPAGDTCQIAGALVDVESTYYNAVYFGFGPRDERVALSNCFTSIFSGENEKRHCYEFWTSASGSAGPGVYVQTGDNQWTLPSRRETKEDFRRLPERKIASRAARVPLMSYRYKAASDRRCFGSTAQDWARAFHGLIPGTPTPEEAGGIGMMDAAFVALITAREAHRKIRRLERQLRALRPRPARGLDRRPI